MERGQNTRKDKRMWVWVRIRFKGCTNKSSDCSWMETRGQSDIGYVGFNVDKRWSINTMSLKVFRIIEIEL